jgi:serine/threonine protein kinase
MAFDGPMIGGRYRLGPRLGKGSQGEIHIARDDKAKGAEDREVVVKRLIPRGTWKSFELFEREAKVLSQLRHPGVPRHVATIEEPPGTFNLVLPRGPGHTRPDLSARRRLSQLELRDVLIRCLEILDYLHTRTPAVVHRDLKPSNIMRGPDGKVSLVDFGGVLDAARDRGGSTIVGTYGYMAPEQLHGQTTPATDLYALGATIVALAGGVEPEDVPRKGLAMDLAKHLPSLSPGFRAALTAMVEPDPDRRPARPRDVLALLAKAPDPEPLPARPKALLAPQPRALARPIFTEIPEPLRAALRLALLAVAVSGWFAMAVTMIIVQTFGAMVGVFAGRTRRPMVRGAASDVAGVLGDGQDGFSDLARRAVARRR